MNDRAGYKVPSTLAPHLRIMFGDSYVVEADAPNLGGIQHPRPPRLQLLARWNVRRGQDHWRPHNGVFLMKVDQLHREALRALIERQWTAEQLRRRWRQNAEAGGSTRRFLFDLFYMIPTGERLRWIDSVNEALAPDRLEDDHIFTALKQVVPAIEAGREVRP